MVAEKTRARFVLPPDTPAAVYPEALVKQWLAEAEQARKDLAEGKLRIFGSVEDLIADLEGDD